MDYAGWILAALGWGFGASTWRKLMIARDQLPVRDKSGRFTKAEQ